VSAQLPKIGDLVQTRANGVGVVTSLSVCGRYATVSLPNHQWRSFARAELKILKKR
jgi:hypothetical protein